LFIQQQRLELDYVGGDLSGGDVGCVAELSGVPCIVSELQRE
jgi:hypothetical protein